MSNRSMNRNTCWTAKGFEATKLPRGDPIAEKHQLRRTIEGITSNFPRTIILPLQDPDARVVALPPLAYLSFGVPLKCPVTGYDDFFMIKG